MITIEKQQVDELHRQRWRSYIPRIEHFIASTMSEVWEAMPEPRREELVLSATGHAERIGFRQLESVLKFAGLGVATNGAFLDDRAAMAYLSQGDNPDQQLERLIVSMRVADILRGDSSDVRLR